MTTYHKLGGGLLAAASLLALAVPAAAQTDQSRLEALEAQIGALKSELDALKAQPAPAAATDVRLSPSPRFTSADGNFTFRPRGRIELDVGGFDVDAPAPGVTDIGDFVGAGTQLRRARLGAEGVIAGTWGYRFEVDLAGSAVAVQDVYLQYNGFDSVGLTIGQHKAPNSLDRLAASTSLLFLERANVIEAFTNAGDSGGDRRLGVSASFGGDAWSVSAGVFGDPVNVSNSEGWGVHGRAAWAPVNTDDRLVHIGASGFWRDAGNSNVRFRDRPEVRIDNQRVIDTLAIQTDSYNFVGLEGIAAFGPVFLTGEYATISVDRPGALTNVDFDGFYIAGGWFLTGERLPYAGGVIDRVRPARPFSTSGGGAGAWAVTARYSTIDLNDVGGAIAGGKNDVYTLGLNWYPHQNVRVLFNASHFDSERAAFGNIANPVVGVDGTSFVTRLAVDW